VIAQLRPLCKAKSTDLVDLHLSLSAGQNKPDAAGQHPAALNDLLYADHLLLITTVITRLKAAGCVVQMNLKGLLAELGTTGAMPDGRVRYASRVDFFKLLGLDLLENFSRRPGKDRFIEITHYNRDNYFDVGKKIIQVVAAHARVDRAVQQMLDFCLFEIMDNVLIHAAYPQTLGGQGWCSAQYFPAAQSIRLMIADTGIGIHRALTRHPNSKYQQLTAYQALSQCVQKGVTNGEGMGFGLYATLQFARQNQGEMLIYSGEYYGTLKEGRYLVKKGAYWQGTLVFLNIRTNVPIDYKTFMSENQCLAEDFDFIHGQSS